ncbi:MAG: thioredoxin fold domain-containing protein [Deltaproteobacteria bacterium]|nr:thioredoxin fold domain-containing protein [Deltaproteobacteria bacterium]MBN2674380.1 thioredoxin fold domain-containing protein [Deltaproteobacteria bacterium]
MAEKLLNVTDSNFIAEVEQSSLPVLVDFGATWCAPCKALGVTLDAMVDDYAGRAKFCYVDIQQAPGAAAKFGIRSVPTVIVFKNGAPAGSLMGAVDRNKLADLLKAVL